MRLGDGLPARRRATLLALGIGVGLAVLSALGAATVLRGGDETAQGLLLRLHERPWNDEVVIVEINQYSLARHGWPLPRDIQAVVLGALDDAGAKVVAYDIDVSAEDPRGADNDALFGAVARRSGRVVFPVEPRAAELERVVLPVDPLAASGRLSHGMFAVTRSGRYRGSRAAIDSAEDRFFPLAVEAVRVGRGLPEDAIRLVPGGLQLGDTLHRVTREGALLASLREDPGPSGIPLHWLLDGLNADTGRLAPKLAERVRARYVLVGQTAHSIADVGPLADGRLRPLVELHAAQLSDLLEGRVPRELGGVPRLLVVGVCALLAAILGALLRPVPALLGALGLLGVFALVLYLTAGADLLLPAFSTLVGSALSFAGAAVGRFRVQDRAYQELRTAFGRFAKPEVVAGLLENPDSYQGRGGARKDLSILFSDIKGYTSLSNELPPEVLLRLLDDYMAAMTAVVSHHEGRIDKIMGDGILAYFGDIIATEDHAAQAVRCALAMQGALEGLVERWALDGLGGLTIRIGVATGEVFIGFIGSGEKAEHTVIGATVNLAARLESSAPPGAVVVSRETREATGDRFEYQLFPGLELEGFEGRHDAFLCLGPAAGEGERRRSRRVHTDAGAHLEAKGETREVQVLEVSAGGLSCVGGRELALGTVVGLTFDASASLPEVHIRGSVRHVEPAGEGRWKSGIELDHAEAEPEALSHFVRLFFGAPEGERVRGDAGRTFTIVEESGRARLERDGD